METPEQRIKEMLKGNFLKEEQKAFLRRPDILEIFNKTEKDTDNALRLFELTETEEKTIQRIKAQIDIAMNFEKLWNEPFIDSMKTEFAEEHRHFENLDELIENFEPDLEKIPTKIALDGAGISFVGKIIKRFLNHYQAPDANSKGFQKFLSNGNVFDKFYAMNILIRFLPMEKDIKTKFIILSEVGAHSHFVPIDATPDDLVEPCKYLVRRSFLALIRGSVATFVYINPTKGEQKYAMPVQIINSKVLYTVPFPGRDPINLRTFSEAVSRLVGIIETSNLGCEKLTFYQEKEESQPSKKLGTGYVSLQ